MSTRSAGRGKLAVSSSDDESSLEDGDQSGSSSATTSEGEVEAGDEDNQFPQGDVEGDTDDEDDAEDEDGQEDEDEDVSEDEEEQQQPDGGPEEDVKEVVAAIAKRLRSCSNKDTALKALKELTGVLENAPQDESFLDEQGPAAAAALLACASKLHHNKDVKVAAAVCLTDLLRIYAPTLPVASDEELEEATMLVVWALGQLTLPSAPTFRQCLDILQMYEETMLHRLAIHLGREVVNSMFTTLLNAITDDNAGTVERSALEVLCGLLEDCAPSKMGITDDMLASLLSALISGSEVSHRAAHSVILRCKPILRARMHDFCAFLASPTTKAGSLPKAVRPVLQELRGELEEVEEGRSKAVMQLMLSMLQEEEAEHGDDEMEVEEDVCVAGRRQQPARKGSGKKAGTTEGSAIKPTPNSKSKPKKQAPAVKGSHKKGAKESRGAAAKLVQQVIHPPDGAVITDWNVVFQMKATDELVQRYAALKGKETFDQEDVEEVADLLKQGPSVEASYTVAGQGRAFSFYPTPLRMDKEFKLVEGGGDDGDTLFIGYEPGRAALVMVRGCSGDCCKGKYQGEPVVLEGIEGELKRWLVQHEVEPWLQNNSLLNKAILHVGKSGAAAPARTPPQKAASADAPTGKSDQQGMRATRTSQRAPPPAAAAAGGEGSRSAAVSTQPPDLAKRKSAAGTAGGAGGSKSVPVSRDEEEGDDEGEGEPQHVGPSQPQGRGSRKRKAGQAAQAPGGTRPASKKQHTESSRPAPAPGGTRPGPAAPAQQITEDELLQQLDEAYRELDRAEAAVAPAQHRVRETTATQSAAEAQRKRMTQPQPSTSPHPPVPLPFPTNTGGSATPTTAAATPAEATPTPAEVEQACVEAQVQVTWAHKDAEKVNARVQAAAERVALVLAQLVEGDKAGAAGGSGAAAAASPRATSSRQAAAGSKGAAGPPRSNLQATAIHVAYPPPAPASNPLQEALDKALADAEQKQATAQAADARAQELRAVADQLAQEAEAAKQAFEDLSLTIDNKGSEFKSKKAAVLQVEANAATADFKATEAGEQADAARQEASAAQQRVAQARHDIDHAVEHAEAAEMEKVSAYAAARAATADAEEQVKALEAQLEQARKRQVDTEAAVRTALKERVEAARQLRVAREVKGSQQQAAGALGEEMQEGEEAE